MHVDVLHGIDGSLTVKVDDFDTEPVHGMEPFLFIFARLRMQAQVANLDAVDFLMGPAATFQLEDGSGAVDMDVAVDHGHFAPESRVSYRTDHVGVEVSPTTFTSTGSSPFRRVYRAASQEDSWRWTFHAVSWHSTRAPTRRSSCKASVRWLLQRPSTSCRAGRAREGTSAWTKRYGPTSPG